MLDELTFQYYRKLGSSDAFLVLHGGGPNGIETPFIASVIDALKATKQSVLAFNFPYCERGEELSSGPELVGELAALEQAIQFLRNEGYEQITIVAKSLGGIVASYWLAQHPAQDVRLAILGYVLGSVDSEALRQNLALVIQGEYDRFGNADAVHAELERCGSSAAVTEITGADHSYCDEHKEPVYQKLAVEQLL
jgi:predicted alpha/beta-hydrolase family hydrolase